MTTQSFAPLTKAEADVLRHIEATGGEAPPFSDDTAHALRSLRNGGCIIVQRYRRDLYRLTGHGEMMLREYEEQHGNP